jgi:hypothetical protein
MYNNFKHGFSWSETGNTIGTFFKKLKNVPVTWSGAFGTYIAYINHENKKLSPVYNELNSYNNHKLLAICVAKGIIYGETFPLSAIFALNNSVNHVIPLGSFRSKKPEEMKKN